jgi:glycosyltransferase involved in cell wall biosynthesis
VSSSKVAVQLISTGGVYGAERVLLELATYLQEQGWESHVLALEGRGAEELVRRAAALGLAAEAFTTGARLGLVPLLRRLRRSLGGYRQLLVHSHGYKPDLLLRLLNVPRRLACVATVHSAYSEITKLRMLESLDRRALRGFDHAVGVSEQIRAELLAAGVAADRATVIENGISVPPPQAGARQEVRDEFHLPAASRVLLQIGRLISLKRIDLIIAALARLPDGANVHLLIVGEGEQRALLEGQVKSSALEARVHFCGYRSDVPRLLFAADAMVLASDTEGLPVTILEAMAARCPIVTTSVGAIPRVLSAERDAWLVPAGDLDGLVAAIDAVLTDPDLAQRRAESAWQRFQREYSREAMGARYLRIYDSVWARRGWN